MGSGVDQPEFPARRDGYRGRDEGPGTPVADGLEAPPQKTLPQKPKPAGYDDGPAFDFASPAVLAAEASLREAAEALEAALEVPLQDGPAGEGAAGYRALMAAVEESLPPFHACYDAWSAAVLATGSAPIACSKGCGSCCSHYVSSVEPFEILRMHGHIRKDPAYPSRLVAFHRRATLFNGLLAGRMDEEADDRALYRYYLRNLPCPFLKSTGECGVYEHRPMSCRMFFSQSHPSLCRGKAAASPGNRNFILELPEDIEARLARVSRRMERFGLSENFFEGLMDANARFGAYDADGPAAP